MRPVIEIFTAPGLPNQTGAEQDRPAGEDRVWQSWPYHIVVHNQNDE